MSSKSTIVGIDLGTTNTSVAAAIGTKVTILTPGDGTRSFPSVVSLPEPRQVLVGAAARARSPPTPGARSPRPSACSGASTPTARCRP
jgi:molecular chaperone DnaK (HSP70)